MNQEARERAVGQLDDLARRAMLEHGLEPDFSPGVLREVAALKGPATANDGSVRDQRDLLWTSIDNDDTRDLDQLAVAEPLAGGIVKVLVAIADVDALVHRNSAIDSHARRNTTSVYTPAGVFPMVPERLSTDLTSLNEHADRLSVVVELLVAEDGEVADCGVYRAWVRNKARLTYDGVAAWLDGAGEPDEAIARLPGLAEQLRLQHATARRLRQHRHEHGALRLETGEARVVIREGLVARLEPVRKNWARELIEDFMIAANGLSARYLQQRGIPTLRRVVRAPERWDRIVRLAAELGETLPAEPDSLALAEFLNRRRAADPAAYPDLSLAVVKLMGSGEYAVERPGESPPGHFGLSVRDYTHSTAPNRRYPDLVTQRLLKAAVAGQPPPYDEEALARLARHCTRQEDAANKVERQVRKAAAALLLSGQIGHHFEAIVTGASPKGTWVRLLEPPVEGKLVEGAAGADVGDRLRVQLLRADIRSGHIDFRRIRR